jgi:hypothetical protein
MPEPHLRVDLGQATQIGRRGGVRIDAQLPGRIPFLNFDPANVWLSKAGS